VTRRLAHEPLGWRPTTLLITIRGYRWLTGEAVRALTRAEDEESAALATMPAQMADALGRRRRGSA
jgi:hypothetical protein